MRGGVALCVWAGLLGGASCYSPSPATGAPCSASEACPSSQVCDTSQSPPVCVSGLGGHPDAPAGGDGALVDSLHADGGHADAAVPVDAVVIDGPPGLCFGTGLVKDKCFTSKPTGTLDFAGSATTTISTSSTGSGGCTQILAQASGPALCMIGADTITIESGAVVTATGPNVLVLVAATALGIHGTLDVSSHAGSTARGAGAPATCNGGNGGNAVIEGGGGGGAGGSFALVGGAGGAGTQGGFGSAAAGSATAAVTLTVAIGGCPGGNGGNGGFGGGQGSGGRGGGAAYLIAGTSITIDGVLRANGGGGAPGTKGLEGAGGGGGGGAGGLIGLDAPTISVTGALSANGGGGAGGGGQIGSAAAGSDSTSPTTPAGGGIGTEDGGGNGGAGSTRTTLPGVGQDSGSTAGGGGGGGGGGAIRVFQVQPATLGGTISPAPT